MNENLNATKTAQNITDKEKATPMNTTHYFKLSLGLFSADMNGTVLAAYAVVLEAKAKNMTKLGSQTLRNWSGTMPTRFAISHEAPEVDIDKHVFMKEYRLLLTVTLQDFDQGLVPLLFQKRLTRMKSTQWYGQTLRA